MKIRLQGKQAIPLKCNWLEEVTRQGLLIREFILQFSVKCELLDFCMKVKEFLELSSTCEKSQNFYVNVFCKVV